MNANELADELEIAQGNNNADELIPEAIAMLRQQQAEIEVLKSHPVKEQSNLVKVVQDHVKDLKRCVKVFRTQLLNNTANEMEVAIKELEDALESHPVKELTDEEIKEVIRKHWNREYKNKSMLEFARAILRKAQEK